MRIGELANRSRVSAQTLRYYERRGLFADHPRTPAGYRDYAPDAVRRVRFIKRAQALGFTLDEIGDLLGLWRDSSKSCAAVERRASATLSRIEAKIGDLRKMQDALAKYVAACRGRSALQQCPLLEELGVDRMSDD
jgi:MerR family transcriptional regulator, copper efflux regulator